MTAQTPRTTASERFLHAAAAYQRVFVVTHDNPDPDAVATGWAIALLVQEKLGKEVRLLGGGDILRAENRHMVELLSPPIELVPRIDCPEGTAVVLVDCQPGSENHIVCDSDVVLMAAIDHHPTRGPRAKLAFRDIRPRVAASASIAASYLREQGLAPGTKLATALLFAIRTETRGGETYHSRLDRSVLPWLTERADPRLLAEIDSAPLRPAYYGDLILALQNTFLYGDSALCLLPRASGPEIVGEVADLLIRCEAIFRVLCGAVVHGDMVLSIRTRRDDDDAGELARTTLEGLGSAGGHLHRAGGKVSGLKISEAVQEDLRRRWLEACNVGNRRGVRLVALREIKENLAR